MSLDKQMVRIDFTSGPSGDDKFRVPPNRLEKLQNALFEDSETIVRRGGTSTFTTVGTSTGSVFTHGEKVACDSNAPLTTVTRKCAVVEPIIQLGSQDTSGNIAPTRYLNFDAATNGTYRVVASEVDWGANVRLVRIDTTKESDGSLVKRLILSDADATGYDFINPRVIKTITNEFVVICAKVERATPANWTFKYVVITASSDSAVQGSTTFQNLDLTGRDTYLDPYYQFDVMYDGITSRLFIVSATANTTTDGGGSSSKQLLFNGLSRASATLYSNDAAYQKLATMVSDIWPRAVTLLAGYNSSFNRTTVAFYHLGTSAVRRVGTLDGSNLADGAAFTMSVANDLGRMVLLDSGLGEADEYRIYYERASAASGTASYTTGVADKTRNIIGTFHFNPASGAVTNRVDLIGGCNILGRPSSDYLLPVFTPRNDLYTSAFVISTGDYANAPAADDDAETTLPMDCVARFAVGNHPFRYHLWTNKVPVGPGVLEHNFTSQNCFLFQEYSDATVAVGAGTNTPVLLKKATFNTAITNLPFTTTHTTTRLDGACPLVYDGVNIFEEGFNTPPVAVVSSISGSGGSLSIGDVQTCMTWVYFDANGDRHESLPSEPTTSTVTASDIINFTVAPCLLTAKWEKPTNSSSVTKAPNVYLQVYRTVSGGSIFYRDSMFHHTLITGATAGQYIDDAELISGDTLPSTGNVLPTDPSNHSLCSTVHQGRVFYATSDKIYFSREITAGIAPEFSELLYRIVPKGLGTVCSLASMDDKVVIIGTAGLGVIFGSGPTATGDGDNYSAIAGMPLSAPGLANSPFSLATDVGVWYPSSRGPRLLDRGLRLAVNQAGVELGSEISDRTSTLSAHKCGGIAAYKSLIVFGYSVPIVFDTQFRQWSEFTVTAYSAVMADSTLFFHTTNSVLKYDDTLFTDSGSAFEMYMETGWLQLAGIQGFQRVTHLQVLGRTNADTTTQQRIRLYTATDYGALAQVVSTDLTPATGGMLQFEHHLPTQKCQALKIGIYNRPTSDATDRLRIVNLSLRVGVKAGKYKLPSSKRI